MITTIDVQAAKLIRAEVAAALTAIAEKHGLKCDLGKTTFAPEGGTIRIGAEFAVGTIGGVDRDRVLFDRDCRMVGLEPGDFGKVFTTHSGTFKVTGVSLNRPKYPIDGVSVPDGRKLRWTPKTGQDGSLDQTQENDSNVEEETSTQCPV